MKQGTTQFEFAAKPKVTAVKPKYRQETRFEATNLMNDPRVVRGNTYAAIVENKNEVQPPPRKQQNKEQPRKQQRRPNFDTGFEVSTPRAVSGREHCNVQTEAFVETLRDRPIQYEKEVQSDLFLDRPVERAFAPAKSGVDRPTQVEENDPELFDFDYEVQPIVDALLAKILETSRMELHQERTLTEREAEKDDFERRRRARLADAQKLEANETRLKEEYDRRQLQYRRAAEADAAAHRKLVARELSKQFLRPLRSTATALLNAEGFFRHPLQHALFADFAPWLYGQVVSELRLRREHEEAAELLLAEAQKDLLREGGRSVKEEADRRAAIQAERVEAAERKEAHRAEKARLKEEAERQTLQEQNQQQEVPPS